MLASYLERVGLTGKPELTAAGLKQLHIAQHRTIPFENFDVIAGKTIALSSEALLHKLVHSQRGGYCFEVNGLMSLVLQELGFEARALLGRVHLGPQPSGRSHFVNLVSLADEQWLVDVGFGALNPRAPLRFVYDIEQTIEHQVFRLIRDPQFGCLLQMQDGDHWNPLYSLDLTHVCAGDIDHGNFFSSHSPNSVFTSSCVAALATEQGSITLLNNRLKIKQGEQVQEISLDTEADYFRALKTHFGLEL